MQRTFLLSIAVFVLVAFGCFDTHENGDQDKDRADGGDDTANGQTDDSNGTRPDRDSDDSDGERSNDIEDIFSQPPEEAAEAASDR